MERYNGPQEPWPLPGPQEEDGEKEIRPQRKREKGKSWSKEKKVISKESGHRHAPGLFLGMALWLVCLTERNKPSSRAILENRVMSHTVKVKLQ